jgi:hypothetical protein
MSEISLVGAAIPFPQKRSYDIVVDKFNAFRHWDDFVGETDSDYFQTACIFRPRIEDVTHLGECKGNGHIGAYRNSENASGGGIDTGRNIDRDNRPPRRVEQINDLGKNSTNFGTQADSEQGVNNNIRPFQIIDIFSQSTLFGAESNGPRIEQRKVNCSIPCYFFRPGYDKYLHPPSMFSQMSGYDVSVAAIVSLACDHNRFAALFAGKPGKDHFGGKDHLGTVATRGLHQGKAGHTKLFDSQPFRPSHCFR